MTREKKRQPRTMGDIIKSVEAGTATPSETRRVRDYLAIQKSAAQLRATQVRRGDAGWLTAERRTVAAFFGVTLESVDKWCGAGAPWDKQTRMYDLSMIARWRIARAEHRRGVEDPLMVGGDNSPALERYRTARAKLAELDLAVKRGELLPREQVLGTWRELWGAVCQVMVDIERTTGVRVLGELFRQGVAQIEDNFKQRFGGLLRAAEVERNAKAQG